MDLYNSFFILEEFFFFLVSFVIISYLEHLLDILYFMQLYILYIFWTIQICILYGSLILFEKYIKAVGLHSENISLCSLFSYSALYFSPFTLKILLLICYGKGAIWYYFMVFPV